MGWGISCFGCGKEGGGGVIGFLVGRRWSCGR